MGRKNEQTQKQGSVKLSPHLADIVRGIQLEMGGLESKGEIREHAGVEKKSKEMIEIYS